MLLNSWNHILTVVDGDDLEDVINVIVDHAHDLWGDEMFKVKHFGKNQDLSLIITKDEEYDPRKDESYADLVDIATFRQGRSIDDTTNIYVTDGELAKELRRIFHEKDMSTL